MTDTLRVHLDELDFGDEQLMVWKGKPFTGVAIEYFPDGKLQSEVPHIDGLEHGLKRAWYPSGQLRKEANLWYGSLHGHLREWDEQGRLISEMIGELGVGVAERRWDEQGRLVKDWHIGPTDDLYEILLLKRKKWSHLAPPL